MDENKKLKNKIYNMISFKRISKSINIVSCILFLKSLLFIKLILIILVQMKILIYNYLSSRYYFN